MEKTISGLPVKIIKKDLISDYPWVGVITLPDGLEVVRQWDEMGNPIDGINENTLSV